MSDNLSDVIIISVMWISAAVGCIFLKNIIPFALALTGMTVYIYYTR